MTLKPDTFLVNDEGEPTAVVFRMTTYRKLLHWMEELEDALDLKHAIESSPGMTDHRMLVARLKKARRL